MKIINNYKLTIITIIIGIILIGTTVSGIPSARILGNKFYSDIEIIKGKFENPGPENWALLFAVGIYKNHPEQNRDTMLEEVEDFYTALIDAPEWQADHIHKVTGTEATGRRLIKELKWLIDSEDSDDISLVYITTHGAPLRGFSGAPIDLPPFDENDGADEILVMYEGFDKWYAFIWDDLLNFFLSQLESEGVCLVVDSCYSGGFNDPPFNSKSTLKSYSAESFTQGLIEDVASQGRVICMSCQEYESCYGSYFSDYFIGGLNGLADFGGNIDGINSAEEAFYFSKFWVEIFHSFTPTIRDLYPKNDPSSGELPLTTWVKN